MFKNVLMTTLFIAVSMSAVAMARADDMDHHMMKKHAMQHHMMKKKMMMHKKMMHHAM